MAETIDQSVSFMLGEIKGRLDQVILQLGVKDERDTKLYAEIDSRILAVEKKQHWYAGAAAVISAAAAWFLGPHSGT